MIRVILHRKRLFVNSDLLTARFIVLLAFISRLTRGSYKFLIWLTFRRLCLLQNSIDPTLSSTSVQSFDVRHHDRIESNPELWSTSDRKC